MIRARREEDLDRLCAVLKDIDGASEILSGKDPREWLEEHDAEQSWVFDQAPVTVAPTKNVVGHVQIYNPEPAGKLLVIDKLFVKPNTHEYGIARYLLKESIKYIQGQGKIPGLSGTGFLPKEFYEKYGFEDIPSADPAIAPMIYTK